MGKAPAGGPEWVSLTFTVLNGVSLSALGALLALGDVGLSVEVGGPWEASSLGVVVFIMLPVPEARDSCSAAVAAVVVDSVVFVEMALADSD